MKIYERTGLVVYTFMKPFLGIFYSGRLRTRALITHNSQVLLVRNWKGNQNWVMPGGGVKKGESPKKALIRELKEELDLDIKDTALKFLFKSTAEDASAKFPVVIYGLKLAKKPLFSIYSPEILEAKWFDINKLPENANNLVVKAIKSHQ